MEYWCPFQWYQVTPSFRLKVRPSRYMPFRFEWRQVLYHQAPWYSRAQFLLPAASLSSSRVENDWSRWIERESPAVPLTKNSEISNRLYNSYKIKNIPALWQTFQTNVQSHLCNLPKDWNSNYFYFCWNSTVRIALFVQYVQSNLKKTNLPTWVRAEVQLVLVILIHNTKPVILGISSIPFKVFQVHQMARDYCDDTCHSG